MQDTGIAHRTAERLTAVIAKDRTMHSTMNVAVFDTIRQELDELCIPLNRWMWAAPAEREPGDREQVMSLPVDLAWYGWQVTMLRSGDTWQVTICKTVEDVKVKIEAEGKTYLDALGELAWQATQQLDRIEAIRSKAMAKVA